MNQLELKKRKFPSKQCRSICQRFYGREIYNSVWSDWRGAIGIEPRSKWITGDQFLRLCAIASVRKDHRRPLLLSEILQAEAIVFPLLQGAIAFLDRDSVLGADVPLFLHLSQGCAPHASTLYRKIPRFSKGKTYPRSFVLQVA